MSVIDMDLVNIDHSRHISATLVVVDFADLGDFRESERDAKLPVLILGVSYLRTFRTLFMTWQNAFEPGGGGEGSVQ